MLFPRGANSINISFQQLDCNQLVLWGKMGVAHGHLNFRVPHQFRDRADIHVGHREAARECVSKVTADIHARDVVVYGHVQGNIRAKGRIEIKKNGSVIGKFDYGADHD
jgi:hypothetical protein